MDCYETVPSYKCENLGLVKLLCTPNIKLTIPSRAKREFQ